MIDKRARSFKPILAGIVLILLLLSVVRYFYVMTDSLSGGQYQESPNKQFTAYTSDVREKLFWGGIRCFYKLWVEDNVQGKVPIKYEAERRCGDMIDWRDDEGSIVWSSDGKTVTFKFPDEKLNFKVQR